MATKISTVTENVKSYLEIRQAANELLNYVSFASLTELVETQSQVAASVTKNPVVDGRISEMLLSSVGAVPLYDSMRKIIEDIKTQAAADASAAVAIAVAGDTTNTSDTIQITEVDAIASDSSILRDKKISMVQHSALSRVDYASALTDISALFCSLIPATEMSLCVPMLDVRIIYPQDSPGSGLLSTLRFVGIAPSATSKQSGKSSATDAGITAGYTSEDTGRKYGYDVAGMEIFCLPQTLSAPSFLTNTSADLQQRGVQILEPMMPLLTLDSANIQQVGINGSLYAQTKIDLKMILHDRSRLSDVEALVSADVFPTVTFRITYGWIHPDSNKFSSNPYAKLLNSMRVTQDFAVSSVNLSTKDATSMNLGISLISLGSQVSKGAKVMTAGGAYIPYTAVMTLLKQFIRVKSSVRKKTEGDQGHVEFSSVGSTILASSTKGSTSGKFIKIEPFYQLYEYVSSLTGENPEVDIKKMSELTETLNQIENNGVFTPATEEFTKIFEFQTSSTESGAVSYGSLDKLFTLVNVPTEFSTKIDNINNSANKQPAQGSGSRPSVVPLSALVGRLVAKPLVLSQPDIDEVRIHFFSFNSGAGKMAEDNIGNFPIEIKKIIEHTEGDKKEKVAGINQSTSVEAALGFLLKQLNDPASIYYGHNKEFLARQTAIDQINEDNTDTDLTESQKEEIQKKIDTVASQAEESIDKNNGVYLSEKTPPIKLQDSAYVPPRIKSQIDVLPAYGLNGDPTKPDKKIARIIIYDERAGGFNKLGNLIFSMINTNGIARLNESSFSESAVTEEVKKISTSYDVKSLFTLKLSTEAGKSDPFVTYALSNKSVARQIASNLYPTITIGTDSTCIISANYSSQPAGDVASSYLLTALQGGSSTSTSGQGSNDDLAGDVLILPSSITLNMLGNVCISRGQTYYVDFNTGTTLDNAYTVQSVTHSMKPGSFTTSVTLFPTNAATMRSLTRQLQELSLKIRDVTGNPTPSGKSATSPDKTLS